MGILHLPLDHCDMDDGRYIINANNPIVEAATLLHDIKLVQLQRLSAQASDNSEAGAACVLLKEKNNALDKTTDELKKCCTLIEALKRENKSSKQKSERNMTTYIFYWLKMD